VRSAIAQRFPECQVVGSNYPPSPVAVVGAKLVNAGMWSAIALTHAGDSISRAFGVTVPEFVDNLKGNKMGSTLGAWFIGNTLSQNMLNTGAFEVYYDGETIFSKIESHRLPSMPELMNDLTIAIERYQQKALGDTSEPAPAAAELPA